MSVFINVLLKFLNSLSFLSKQKFIEPLLKIKYNASDLITGYKNCKLKKQ